MQSGYAGFPHAEHPSSPSSSSLVLSSLYVVLCPFLSVHDSIRFPSSSSKILRLYFGIFHTSYLLMIGNSHKTIATRRFFTLFKIKKRAAEATREKRIASFAATQSSCQAQGMPKWRVRFYRSKNIPLNSALYSIASHSYFTTDCFLNQSHNSCLHSILKQSKGAKAHIARQMPHIIKGTVLPGKPGKTVPFGSSPFPSRCRKRLGVFVTFPSMVIPAQKSTRKTGFRVLFIGLSVCDSGLADSVDVTGQVEHLVGEAPLVEGATAYPPLLASLARTSRLPDFTVFSALFSFKCSFWSVVILLFVVVLRATTFFIPIIQGEVFRIQAI